MTEISRNTQIQRHIQDARQRWETCSGRVEAIKRDMVLELDGEKKFVLEQRLERAEQERDRVEAELERLERDASRLSSDQWASQTIDSASPEALVAELLEWKRIHNESQSLLNVLDVPLNHLMAYRYKPDLDRLDEAGYNWQELCVPKLRSIPDQWQLEYVDTPVFDDLRVQTSNLDEITRQLMQTDIQRPEFKMVYAQLKELKGTLWNILIVSDKRIMILIDALAPIVGR